MQLYGDCATTIEPREFARQLLEYTPTPLDLNSLRTWLVGCGQLEQLLSDSERGTASQRTDAAFATDRAASAFYALWSSSSPRAPHPPWSATGELTQSRGAIERLAASNSSKGSLRIPEGFAFYAVFPEQYCAAAVRYLARHGDANPATHVIGLRSIGTTLSAAVSVVLRAAGAAHRRYTLRPRGHPFRRELDLPHSFAPGERALVVDEGPGLSGSSFFAAARALAAEGVPHANTAYFCAHDHGPGAQASPEIRDFWRSATRYVAAHYDVMTAVRGAPTNALNEELEAAFGSPCRTISDLSGGRWRQHTFSLEREWPAAYCEFERPKYLARLADGRLIFLKFYGSVFFNDESRGNWSPADTQAARMIARSGIATRTLRGFVARAWLAGCPLARRDFRIDRVQLLCDALTGRPWLRARAASSSADAFIGCGGRLCPHDWLRLPTGQAIKLPDTLQGYDHTAIESATLGWDFAGATIEWGLGERELGLLLERFAARTGITVERASVAPHIQRYAEFHAEKAAFCARQCDRAEAARLRRDAFRYRSHLQGALR